LKLKSESAKVGHGFIKVTKVAIIFNDAGSKSGPRLEKD